MSGEPVIVRNVLEKTSGLSWEPMVMWRAFRETGGNVKFKDETRSVKATDCLDWCEVGYLTNLVILVKILQRVLLYLHLRI